MTENEQSFRLQIWFGKIEYSDLYADLKAFPSGNDEAGRVRYLLRLGLLAEKSGAVFGSAAGAAINPAPVIAGTEAAQPANGHADNALPVPPPESPPSVGQQLDVFAARGFDVRQFQGFGRGSST